MRRVKWLQGLLGAMLVVASAGIATAQEFRATVKGQVADSSKAAVPGATVTVTNAETNEVVTTVSNAEGNYTLPFLRPGLYNLTVELTGFTKHVRNGLRLEVGQTAEINVPLAVGGLAEEVTVAADAPILETSNANRGTVIDSARIAELPLQSRSPMALAVLVAGVNYNAQAVYLRPFDNGALAAWSMNGGSSSNNEFLLDGAPNNANQGGNNIAYVPPAEAVQEMKISTNSYDAQYGRTAGGVVNMSLKSGTNSFHGVGYDFLRRKGSGRQLVPAQLAQQPEDRPVHRSVRVQRRRPDLEEQDLLPVHRREVPGGHARAAVQHGADRRVQERRFQQSRGRLGQPDPDLRSGDGPRRERRVDARCVPGQQHPGRPDQPDGQGDDGSTTRTPTTSTAVVAPWQRNLAWAEHFNKDVFWNWVGKVDHNFSGNDRTFFRWAENERHEIGNTATRSAAVPAQDGQLPLIRSNRAIVGDWVHIFGAGTVFNLRGGYTYFLEWSQTPTRSTSTRRSSGPPSLVDSCRARRSAACSRASSIDQLRQPVARHEPQPEPELVAPAERLVEPRRAQHPQRSRHPVDQRLQRELQQRRRPGAVQPQLHPQHAEQHQRARRQRLRLVPARRAERRRASTSTRWRTTSGSSPRRGSRTTGASTTS